MLTAEQKRQIADEARAAARNGLAAAWQDARQTIPKRFSPSDIGEPNGGNTISTKDIDHGFKSFSHFLNDVIKASVDGGYQSNELRDLQKKAAGYMEEADLSQGGYTVPTQYVRSIFERSLETAVVRPRAYFQPMSSNRLEIPAQVEDSHASNFFGGVQIQRTGEGGSLTATNPTYSKIGLTLHKVTGLCYVTSELIEDSSIAIEAYISRAFSQAINFIEDEDFLNGSGANQPLGALNSGNPALITVDAVSGQGASTIIAENIIDMYSRLPSESQNRAVWLANPNTFPQLAKLSLSVGTGGIPVWMPAGSMSGRPYRELMGLPVIFTEKAQTLGTAGDIALVDFSAYVIGGRGDGSPKMASSMHLKFDQDQVAFRFVLRYDGQPMWLSALTPRNSTTTLSPFIVLSGTRT